MKEALRIGNVEIELKTRGRQLLGLGRIRIGGLPVRSGDLPIRPFTQTLDGLEYDRYEIESIQTTARRVVIRTRAIATAGAVDVMLDHSLDPVWSTRPWDGRPVAEDRMDWILEADTRTFGSVGYEGFTYQFRFHSARRSIFYILDRATWELGGKAEGITLLRQQMGEDPKVTLRARTDYNTSAWIGYPLNPIMTHDIPRWSSEQGFDYQYRAGDALAGVFDQCGLIRTIVVRPPGEAVIRHFDKHIFEQSGNAATIRKFIGLARGVGDDIDQMNAWTRVFDADQDNMLGEFGMRRTYSRTTLSHNFWVKFDVNSYRKDLLPAAAALGFQQVFIDPLWENDMTRSREGKLPSWCPGNMCCPHEYEVAKVLGGIAGYKRLARDAGKLGVDLISWIGSHQSILSPYLLGHGAQIVKQMDGRHWYGSGYDWIYGMDLSSEFGSMFRDAAIRAHQATGVAGFLYDSFFNFGWMPVNFHTPDAKAAADIHKGALKAHTQWRALCKIMAAWQKAGLHMLIESLGPWGQPQHGVQGHYDEPGSEPLAYQCACSIGYSVIPAPATAKAKASAKGPDTYYRFLANKAPSTLSLWVGKGADGKPLRIDQSAAPIIRQANLEYRQVLPLMHTRTLLADGLGVFWEPRKGAKRAVFAFRKGTLPLPAGTPCVDLTAGAKSRCAPGGLPVQPFHTYVLG